MMWAELLFFGVVIGLAVHQLYSVKKAQRETAEKDAAQKAEATPNPADPAEG